MDLTIKVNAKRERSFDRPTVILKLKMRSKKTSRRSSSRNFKKQLQNPEKVSEQTRLLDLRDVFYSQPKAETKQTMRLDPREVICLITSLLNTFYRF